MDSLSQPGRKRGLTSESPSDEGYADDQTDNRKRSKAVDELELVKLIPKEDAWQFDTADLLDSPTYIPQKNDLQLDGNNFKNYDATKSLFVLCVLGELDLHLHLLCSILPNLFLTSPALQALVVTHSNSQVRSLIFSLPLALPAVETSGNPPNHFLKLGLLHPLGGGRQPLDSIIIIDTSGKRRLVLPFGWGAGKHVLDVVGGKSIQDRLMGVLEESVKALESEVRGADFYSLAKTYF